MSIFFSPVENSTEFAGKIAGIHGTQRINEGHIPQGVEGLVRLLEESQTLKEEKHLFSFFASFCKNPSVPHISITCNKNYLLAKKLH